MNKQHFISPEKKKSTGWSTYILPVIGILLLVGNISGKVWFQSGGAEAFGYNAWVVISYVGGIYLVFRSQITRLWPKVKRGEAGIKTDREPRKFFISSIGKKVLGAVVLIIIVGLAYYYFSKYSATKQAANNNAQEQAGTLQTKTDFFGKYNLYYYDNERSFVKNGEKIEKGGDKFTPDILYSDGVFLSGYSEAIDNIGTGQDSLGEALNSSLTRNDYLLSFQGTTYESSDPSELVLRDKDYIYYKKCLTVEYIKASNGNRCVNTALFSNNDKIDEGGRPIDLYISTSVSNIDLLFVNNGILYYGKLIGGKYNFYSYDPISKKAALYKPELFNNNENDLLGILDTGDIIFSNSGVIYKNSLQSKIFDSGQIVNVFFKGAAVGDNYYNFNSADSSKPIEEQSHGLFKDGLLIANIRSDTYGRIIDPAKQDCHFNNFIYGALSPMYCINKEGTVVRVDKNTNTISNNSVLGQDGVVYIVNNDVIDFYPYWGKNGSAGKDIANINSASFIFDEKGGVSSLVVDANGENGKPNIYIVPYLGDGKIGEPKILVMDATLFGVIKH